MVKVELMPRGQKDQKGHKDHKEKAIRTNLVVEIVMVQEPTRMK